MLSSAVTRREDELRQLFDLVHALERGVVLEVVLGRLAADFSGLIPFDRISCAFLEDDGSRVVSYWGRSTLGPLRINPGYAQTMAGSSLERVLESGQPRILNDLEAYLAEHPASVGTRRIVEEGGRASLTCPLIVDGRPIGFLFFVSGAPGTYTEKHRDVFRQTAGQVSALIEKSRAFEQLVSQNRTLAERNQRLQVVATTDPLTGVLNRRAIDHALQRAWLKHVQDRTSCGVILADIDHFKQINDQWGHAGGDRALREITRRLTATLRKDDACGRFGGEEFLVVVSGVPEPQLLQTAERLRRMVSGEPFPIGDGLHITASFGVAHTALGVSSPAVLLAAADRALYEAKNDGRDRVTLARSA